ncbi:MAG TPA: hypothetical protein VHX14_08825 [Thermoanaerobaculia bacterium]|nr:hypothetical protein [Thermoanaerobaculia bacterium]
MISKVVETVKGTASDIGQAVSNVMPGGGNEGGNGGGSSAS